MAEITKGGSRAAESLMAEIEALFSMTVEQRESIENAVYDVTSVDTPEVTYEQFYDTYLQSLEVTGQPMECTNWTDGDGNPDGGYVDGPGLQIRWQRGPINNDDTPWNGCFLVSVLSAAKHQLEFYQRTKFACDANEQALADVNSAIKRLNERQVARFTCGIRGKHKV